MACTLHRNFANHEPKTQPGYHPQRPIIVDSDALESPDTVTLRYEEEAAVRANGGGGDLRGGSSPDLLPMAAYKPHPPQMHGE